MFLHDGQIAVGRPLPYLSKVIDGVLYPLWDVGLKIGHAVRSLRGLCERSPTGTCSPKPR